MLKDLFKIASIPELIDYANKLDISHQNLYIKATYRNKTDDVIKVNFFSVLDKYYDYIKSQSREYNFNEKEFKQYKYQPKRLSMNLYGTMELWGLIMRINNIPSILSFSKKKLILPSPKTIKRILNEILILEYEEIERNSKTLLKE